MLSPYRVLDLTNERGQLAGAVLAMLGAEVIAVEPPGGSSSRALGPFAGGLEEPNASLHHWAYNRGKRSVVLDLAGSAADRKAFLDLVRGADVLVESAVPGEWAALGLGYDDLKQVNPALVYASLSAFGQDGPKATWAATDLTVWAAAGPMAITGDNDRAPVRVPSNPAWAQGATELAGAIVAALYERAGSGLGQHLDVSAQVSAMQSSQSNVLAVPNNADQHTRGAGGAQAGPFFIRMFWPCADGFVSVLFLFGSAIGPATRRLMEWVHEEGFCDEAMLNKDWIAYTEMLFGGVEPPEEYERVKDAVGAFCMSKTKQELLDGAMARRCLIAPVKTMAEVYEIDQLSYRGYWQEVNGIRYPGAWAHMSESPLRNLGPAPLLGADTAAVLAEPARKPAAPQPVSPAPSARPLEGLKVLDFCWVVAGPTGTRVLADLGATVVRVESSRRIDTARTLGPYKDGVTDLERSSQFSSLNAGKLGLSVDPSTPEGRSVILDLVRWADVVTESFSPKAMKAWGLDYENLRQVNPSIVMLSSCLFGQEGPLAGFAGFGTMAAAMAGFFGITGWADRPPCGPYGAFTDYISPRFAVATLLAALDHRRRTGVGQYIDFAQAEAAAHLLAPALLDYDVNHNVWQREGNADPNHHPHGVFRSAGNDEWVAIACATDAQRAALASVVGELDEAAIEQWTSKWSPAEATALLQSLGVPSHGVQNSAEAVVDPQLVHRNHFRKFDHPMMESVVIEGPRMVFSRTNADVMQPGPMLGEHTVDILTGVLGYGEDRLVDLLTSGSME